MSATSARTSSVPTGTPEIALARLRADPTAPIGDALLEQRNLAGIGNVFKSEICFLGGLHPLTPVGAVPDLPGMVAKSKQLLEANKDRPTRITTGDKRRGYQLWVYGRRGPCLRCGTPIRRPTRASQASNAPPTGAPPANPASAEWRGSKPRGTTARNHRWSSSERSERSDETKHRTPRSQPGPPDPVEESREFPSTAGEISTVSVSARCLNSLMTATTNTDRGDLDSARDVLVFARESQAAANRAQADLMIAAVTWAEQHPPESIDEAATWITPGGDTGLTLAGEGAPLVAEFCIAEFALAIGRSTDGGRALVAAAVELKYRLPRVWARVQSGDLEAWRARRIAEATLPLTQEAAAFVDAQVAPFAHRIGIAALERLIDEAIARFMPDKAAEDAEKAADGRHFTIDHQQVSFGGTSQITGELDLADALDLDTAVAKGANELLALGSTDSLDVRRSIAAGQLARNQLALDLAAEHDAGGSEPPPRRARPKPRQVVLHVHLSDTAITGTSGAWSWRGWRTSDGSSPPTRSAPGAPTPTPRSS